MIGFSFAAPDIKQYDTRPHMSAEDKRKAGIDSHIVSVAGQIIAYTDTREEAERVRDEYAAMVKRLKLESLAKKMTGADVDDVFAGLAQGVINIDSGHCVIEAGSRVHKAMETLCRLRSEGYL